MVQLFIRLCLVLIFISEAEASILLKITNIHEIKGFLMIGVYTNMQDFNKRNGCEKCKGYREKVSANEFSVEIRDLQPGWYMIAIYHDLNSNEVLDTNFIGLPVEPYGFSLNRMGLFGASFERSKFYYDGKALNLEISIH